MHALTTNTSGKLREDITRRLIPTPLTLKTGPALHNTRRGPARDLPRDVEVVADTDETMTDAALNVHGAVKLTGFQTKINH